MESEAARALAGAIVRSKKYADVHPDAILRVCAETEGRYKKPGDWEKAVKTALHGVTGAFAGAERRGSEADPLEALLRAHASTAERLPLKRMDAIYGRIFALTGVPGRLLDLACGLNPVYLRQRYPDMRILGVDVSRRCAEICSDPAYPNCAARWADLLSPGGLPEEAFDVALMFKLLPLLERQRQGFAGALLRRIEAKRFVVSFPTRTLGGRNVGMAGHYAGWMRERLPAGLAVRAGFEDGNELFYILERTD